MLSQKSLDAIENAGEDAIAGASQNYLGGGIAGRITTGSMFDVKLLTKADQKVYSNFEQVVKEYFYNLNNGGGDDYMQENVTGKNAKNGYLKNQHLPVSGY